MTVGKLPVAETNGTQGEILTHNTRGVYSFPWPQAYHGEDFFLRENPPLTEHERKSQYFSTGFQYCHEVSHLVNKQTSRFGGEPTPILQLFRTHLMLLCILPIPSFDEKQVRIQ